MRTTGHLTPSLSMKYVMLAASIWMLVQHIKF